MFNKITDEELENKLKAFAKRLGLEWYHYSEQLSGEIRPSLLKQTECDVCIEPEQVEEIDHCARVIVAQQEEIRALREDLSLVMKHLGIKIEHGKRVVTRKKGEKNAAHAQAKD